MTIDKTVVIRYLIFNQCEWMSIEVTNQKVICVVAGVVAVHDFDFFLALNLKNKLSSDMSGKRASVYTSPFVLAVPETEHCCPIFFKKNLS